MAPRIGTAVRLPSDSLPHEIAVAKGDKRATKGRRASKSALRRNAGRANGSGGNGGGPRHPIESSPLDSYPAGLIDHIQRFRNPAEELWAHYRGPVGRASKTHADRLKKASDKVLAGLERKLIRAAREVDRGGYLAAVKIYEETRSAMRAFHPRMRMQINIAEQLMAELHRAEAARVTQFKTKVGHLAAAHARNARAHAGALRYGIDRALEAPDKNDGVFLSLVQQVAIAKKIFGEIKEGLSELLGPHFANRDRFVPALTEALTKRFPTFDRDYDDPARHGEGLIGTLVVGDLADYFFDPAYAVVQRKRRAAWGLVEIARTAALGLVDPFVDIDALSDAHSDEGDLLRAIQGVITRAHGVITSEFAMSRIGMVYYEAVEYLATTAHEARKQGYYDGDVIELYRDAHRLAEAALKITRNAAVRTMRDTLEAVPGVTEREGTDAMAANTPTYGLYLYHNPALRVQAAGSPPFTDAGGIVREDLVAAMRGVAPTLAAALLFFQDLPGDGVKRLLAAGGDEMIPLVKPGTPLPPLSAVGTLIGRVNMAGTRTAPLLRNLWINRLRDEHDAIAGFDLDGDTAVSPGLSAHALLRRVVGVVTGQPVDDVPREHLMPEILIDTACCGIAMGFDPVEAAEVGYALAALQLDRDRPVAAASFDRELAGLRAAAGRRALYECLAIRARRRRDILQEAIFLARAGMEAERENDAARADRLYRDAMVRANVMRDGPAVLMKPFTVAINGLRTALTGRVLNIGTIPR